MTEVLWEGEVAETVQTDKSTAAINVETTGNSRSVSFTKDLLFFLSNFEM